ncbi:MAG TPA: MarR family transcriptional regulator [Baekduia sp.]|nr:MarR family transcriptional regulator [Baekduia sp.]
MASQHKVVGSPAMSVVRTTKTLRAVFTPYMVEIGLRPPGPLVFAALAERDGLTQTEIADVCGSDAPSVTKCLRGLEGLGLVRRERDTEDTRVQRVFLTPEGKELAPRLDVAWQQASSEFFEPLTAAERTQLAALLDKIFEYHRARRPEPAVIT